MIPLLKDGKVIKVRSRVNWLNVVKLVGYLVLLSAIIAAKIWLDMVVKT